MIEIITGGLEQECFEPFYYNMIYRNYGKTRLERLEMEGVDDMCDVAQRLEDRGYIKGYWMGFLEGFLEGYLQGLQDSFREDCNMIYSLVEDKSISVEKGAEKLEISVEKLKYDMVKAGYDV